MIRSPCYKFAQRTRNVLLVSALTLTIVVLVVVALVFWQQQQMQPVLLFHISDELGAYQRLEAPSKLRGALFERLVLSMDKANRQGCVIRVNDLRTYIGTPDSTTPLPPGRTALRYAYSRGSTNLWVEFLVDGNNVMEAIYFGFADPAPPSPTPAGEPENNDERRAFKGI